MIPKGNQRGGGRQLATYLLSQFDNDRVEVVDLRGAVAQDLHGAFHEWYAQSKATRCEKYLYSRLGRHDGGAPRRSHHKRNAEPKTPA